MDRDVHGMARWLLSAGLVLATLSFAAAEQKEQELMVEYVPASVWQTQSQNTPNARRDQPEHVTLWPDVRGRPLTSRSKLTPADRWEKFDDEFGVHHREPSLFKGSVQAAKYNIDQAAFMVDELTRSVEQALKFEYDMRDLYSVGPPKSVRPRIYGDPWTDFVDNARLESDIHLNAFQRDAYLGVKFLFPFGD